MASWRMNNCFAPLNAALRQRFPQIVIYGIGDPAHQAKKSDHNPNKYGRVNAEDYMIRNGFNHSDAVWLCTWLVLDPRTKYVIFNRRIWESDTGEWNRYTGDNPHTDHVHHSVFDSADNNDRPWVLEKVEEMDERSIANEVRVVARNSKEFLSDTEKLELINATADKVIEKLRAAGALPSKPE